jgi:DNA-binding MarR family transcriptional regulator/N-acetylglutamate synthase-like GNAT family acetyltransferase
MPAASARSPVARIRGFNRFYTRQIGVLHEGLLHTPFTLTEGRVLYEVAHQESPTAKGVATALGLDQGYLSRLLRRLGNRRLITQTPARNDGRQRLLALTALGRRTIADLDRRASVETEQMLAHVSATDRHKIVEAMDAIESALTTRESARNYQLRTHLPGDMGWVVQRQAMLYTKEYGWNDEFEAMAARITARFLERFDSARERCWIAERQGEPVGSVFLVKKSNTVAQLRLLFVESHARGLGIGKRLVDECERFARRAGYRKIVLWTQSILHAAHRIYEEAGYRLTREEPHHSFGKDLVGQTWERSLD